MASSCGIHIDQRRFHVIALEGGAKKAKVVAFTEGDIEPGEEPVEVIAAALKRVVKTKKISSDAVGLAVDSGLAAFRNLTLRVEDRGRFEEVL
jgi:Tfp pilus assembly PilM family ATPase